jgi:transcriptional regulator with XRE-family HTH domain
MFQRNNSPIRQLREELGLTQIQLSLRARISLTRVRSAEAGIATTATIGSIARALGVDAWKLRQLVEAENAKVASTSDATVARAVS